MTAMRLKILPKLLIIKLLFLMNSALAQNLTISGKVTSSADKSPVAGVSVTLRQTNNGTTTNQDGNFTITLPSSNGVLLFSHVNFAELEEPVNGRTAVNVTMTPSNNHLSDVVVIRYGTVRKKDLTGSVSQVRAKEIGIFANTSPVQALQVRAAGVQVIQNSGSPGGSISVRIRGTNSVQGSNEPLYVVDVF